MNVLTSTRKSVSITRLDICRMCSAKCLLGVWTSAFAPPPPLFVTLSEVSVAAIDMDGE